MASMQTFSSKVSAGTGLSSRKLNLSRRRAILPAVAASAGHNSGASQAAVTISLSASTAAAVALLLAPNAVSADLSEAFRSPQANGPVSTLEVATANTNPELAGNLQELAAVNQQLKEKAVEQPYGAVTEAAQQYTDEIRDQINDAAAGTKATVRNVSNSANNTVEEASDTVKGAASTASRKVEEAGDKVKGIFGNIKADTKAAADKVQANVKQATGNAGADGSALADKAQTNVKQAAGKVGADGKAVSEQVQANVKGAEGAAVGAGDQAVEGIKNQLGSVKSMLGL